MSTVAIYQERRQKLFEAMPDNSLLVLLGADKQYRNADVEYPFRQNSNFLYLTGFVEPNACLLLEKQNGQARSVLICQPKNLAQECWTGFRLGPDAAPAVLGVDIAYDMDSAAEPLMQHLKTAECLCFVDINPLELEPIASYLELMGHAALDDEARCVDLCDVLTEMRLFKTDVEMQSVRKAVDISVLAHAAAMRAAQPGLSEYHLYSALRAEMINGGCLEEAYPAIVGGGANACILHYVDNAAPLSAGEMVLIDAGAEYNGYAADLTRTFPVSGSFEPHHRDLYEVVLAAQEATIAAAQLGASWDVMQQTILKTMLPGLVDLGILKGSVEEIIETDGYRHLYMHGSGHWLGLDVHDVGAYKKSDKWRPLEPNMLFTIEPGVYIHPSDEVDPRWHNVGIRIEDDIFMTQDGPEVLSARLAKTVKDVEAVCQS